MATRERRLSGRQITVMFVAGCLTLVLLPWGAFAAGKQLVSITGKGGHKVAVTKSNALKVSDGKGPMTVDGKVGVRGPVTVSGNVGVTGPVTTQPAGTPFQVTGSVSAAADKVLGKGKVAITDLVLSHDNSGNERLNATVAVYAGNADCSALTGGPLGYLVNYGYFAVETINTVDLATPLVVEAPTVCLHVTTGSPAGLIATWTVGGYQL
jgi:hypothetical protein